MRALLVWITDWVSPLFVAIQFSLIVFKGFCLRARARGPHDCDTLRLMDDYINGREILSFYINGSNKEKWV